MGKIITNVVNKIKYKIKAYLGFAYLCLSPKKKKDIVDQFHKLYYDSHILGGTWNNTFFLGVPTQKCPLDLFVYQEILYELRPDIIIETGTAFGGGALFLVSICDLINKGRVITIDIKDFLNRPKHRRIKYLLGSSTSDEIVEQIRELIRDKDKILVILDSDHTKEHVLKELMIYSQFVSLGSYIIVEDSNLNGHPVLSEYGPGPMEAIKEFLEKEKDFKVDKSREKHYLTFSPNGYLKRIR